VVARLNLVIASMEKPRVDASSAVALPFVNTGESSIAAETVVALVSVSIAGKNKNARNVEGPAYVNMVDVGLCARIVAALVYVSTIG